MKDLNEVEKWDNVAIVSVKHHFLNFCIIIYQKRSVKKQRKNYKNKLHNNEDKNKKNDVNRSSVEW